MPPESPVHVVVVAVAVKVVVEAAAMAAVAAVVEVVVVSNMREKAGSCVTSPCAKAVGRRFRPPPPPSCVALMAMLRACA